MISVKAYVFPKKSSTVSKFNKETPTEHCLCGHMPMSMCHNGSSLTRYTYCLTPLAAHNRPQVKMCKYFQELN